MKITMQPTYKQLPWQQKQQNKQNNETKCKEFILYSFKQHFEKKHGSEIQATNQNISNEVTQ
jgi:hypothetical protein